MNDVLIAAAVALAGLWKVAQTFGWIPAGPVARAAQNRANAAEDELRAALATLDEQRLKIAGLEARTNLGPLLDRMDRMIEQQDEIAARFEALNGTMKAAAIAHEETARSLAVTGEAIKVLAAVGESHPLRQTGP